MQKHGNSGVEVSIREELPKVTNRTGDTKPDDVGKLNVLVVIANYGTKNDPYLRRLLAEYASMTHKVRCVVLTSVPKTLGGNVEVVVHRPRGNPWTFPFAHKKILANRINDYDLFIYSEDDTLITEKNIDAFLKATAVLREDEIAGFIRSEQGTDGTRYFSTVHGHFHWDPASVVTRGSYTFAHFTNDHSAAYVLTRDQLRRAIRSGGFLVAPHQEAYDLLVSAATDPYTQCRMKKLICITQLEHFVLPHLANRYVGKLGLQDREFFRQISALEAIHSNSRPSKALLERTTVVAQGRWAKRYYEPVRQDLMELIPQGAGRILSYGCGWGEMEAELERKGTKVTSVPLDSVIGACAEARGLQVVYVGSHNKLARIVDDRFDCILITDMLHLVREPQHLLTDLATVMAPRGTVIASVPNLQQLSVLWRRISRRPGYKNLGCFEHSGLHTTSHKIIGKWFEAAGLRIRRTVAVIPPRAARIYHALGRLSESWLASEYLVAAAKD